MVEEAPKKNLNAGTDVDGVKKKTGFKDSKKFKLILFPLIVIIVAIANSYESLEGLKRAITGLSFLGMIVVFKDYLLDLYKD